MYRLTWLLLLVLFCAGATPAFPQEPETPGQQAEHAESPFAVVFRWLNLVVLFAGLAYLLKAPLNDFFLERRAEIRHGLDRARAAQAQASERSLVIEARLAQLGSEVAELKSRMEKDGQAEKQKILVEAKREIDRIASQSRSEIERFGRALELDLRAHLADLVVGRAETDLKATIRSAEHQTIIRRAIARL